MCNCPLKHSLHGRLDQAVNEVNKIENLELLKGTSFAPASGAVVARLTFFDCDR